MAIYRGAGGAGDATGDSASEALLVRELAAEVTADAAAAEAARAAAVAAQTAAELAETNAETAEANAETAETNAETAQAAAASSASGASTSATNAAASASTATTQASNASTSASAASSSASSASSSASTATTQASNASTSATNASNSATAAATSATNASNSATSASTSATNASNSATAAQTAETNAETAETNAAASASSASTSASTATTQAGIATTQASNASTSATNAASSASGASTSASNASTSATNASNSASAASTSATNASNSASAAAASAASAASTYDQFDDRYLGSKSTDPAVDNDGNALTAGALYYNTTDGVMKVYDGGVWISASASSQAILVVYQYTATAAQTTFSGTDNNSLTLGYTVGSAIVTLNGVVLEIPSEVTASSGTSVVLASAAATGDELNVYAFATFELADVYTKTASDARYLSSSNGSVTTAKIADGAVTAEKLGFTLSSNSLTQSIPIDAGKTCTAGKALSLNSDGEVGYYPLFNTLGTARLGATYTMQSRDGSRAITAVVTTNTIASTTWTITGYAISGSANATTGTTATFTITNPNGDGDNQLGLYVFWSGTQDFVLVGRKYSRFTATTHYVKIESALVTVNSSGNVTKGTNYVVYSNTASGGPDAASQFAAGYVKDNVYAIASNEGNSGTRTIFRTITQSGGSFTGATDTEAGSIVDFLNEQSVSYTTNNIIVCPSTTSVLTASYATNNIGTVTTTTGIITDNADSNIYWGRLNDTYLIAAYKKSDNSTILRAFSINQTTGALTSVSTYTLYAAGTYVNFQYAFKDANSVVFTYKDNVTGDFYIDTISLTSGTINGVGNSVKLNSVSNIPVRYTATTDVFMVFNQSENFTYTVLSYLTTGVFTFAGFVNTTTSTSPASVVVAGVASGFTGLTPTKTYYLTSAYDGTLTTDALPTGIKVGVALSSSTLLIRT
jgi:hypothetical protein